VKPHIRFKGDVWSCVSVIVLNGMQRLRAGFGYTPSDAYREWEKQ
jgi:hypothetical protein